MLVHIRENDGYNPIEHETEPPLRNSIHASVTQVPSFLERGSVFYRKVSVLLGKPWVYMQH
jgi:hypothetical protein